MITSRSPWQKAEVKDKSFVEFLRNENYLMELLPISKEANVLFRKIFEYEPTERINLSTLRREIIALPSFFLNNEELARAGEVARDAAAYCGVRVEPIQGGLPAKKAKAVGAVRKERTPAQPPRASPPRCDDLSVVTPSMDITDASVSDVSSEGPVTPASYPVQMEGYIPDIGGLIKDEVMPRAPRIRQSARAFAA